MRFSLLLSGVAFIALVACTTQQISSSVTAVNAACASAGIAKSQALALAKGGALGTVSNIASYVDATCSTAEAVAVVASDPNTVAWLSQLSTSMKDAATLGSPAP